MESNRRPPLERQPPSGRIDKDSPLKLPGRGEGSSGSSCIHGGTGLIVCGWYGVVSVRKTPRCWRRLARRNYFARPVPSGRRPAQECARAAPHSRAPRAPALRTNFVAPRGVLTNQKPTWCGRATFEEERTKRFRGPGETSLGCQRQPDEPLGAQGGHDGPRRDRNLRPRGTPEPGATEDLSSLTRSVRDPTQMPTR